MLSGGERVKVETTTQVARPPLLGKQRPQLFDYDEDQTETTNDTRPILSQRRHRSRIVLYLQPPHTYLALMARLNEPPVAPQPSADNIEVVKRRFLRQNRELAKYVAYIPVLK